MSLPDEGEELITEDRPRIKFQLHRTGCWHGGQGLTDSQKEEVLSLASMMQELEDLGACPVLNDGKVGGNCAIMFEAPDPSPGRLLLVSRSGKQPGVPMGVEDFVRVETFSPTEWAASFSSPSEGVSPSSDTPLLHAALSPLAHQAYGWQSSKAPGSNRPRVAVHGHALAAGEGLKEAARIGLPISPKATLFSTPDDLQELEGLFHSNPYPQHKCFIRTGHGFFVLGTDVEDARQVLETVVLPYLRRARTAATTPK